jgi:iron complex outermembrane receptor protein
MDYGSLEQLFKGPVTTSATGSPQRDTDVPVNMSIVTADDIRRSGARDILGVLRHVPGVDMMQWGADNADISIRGYNQAFASGTLVLVDGRQVYADYYGFVPWSALPVELGAIRQVEVVKGPNAALFGFNAAGGAINIITYNPRYDDVNAVSIRAGSPALGEISGVATVRLGSEGALRVSAGYRNNDDFSTAIPATMVGSPRSKNDRATVDADLVYALGTRVEVGLEASHTHAALNEVSPNYAVQNSKYETNSIQGRLTADTTVGMLQLVAYTNWIAWKGAPSPWLGQFDMNNQVTVVRAEDVFDIGAGHILRLAAAYRHNEVNTTPFSGGTVAYDVWSGSGMWSWQISPELSLTSAIRLDHLALDRSGAAPTNYPFANADWSRALDEISYNFGLIWSLSAQDTVRAIVGRGVQLPSLVESGALLIATPYLSVTGIPSLKPTSVMNYEITWDRELPEVGAKFQIAAFHQNTTNLVSVGGAFAGGPLAPYATPANIGSSRAFGIELTASGKFDEAWHWTAGYRLETIVDRLLPMAAGGIDFADYQHGTPKHLIKAGLGWADGHWEADGYINWQSDTNGLRLSGLGTTRVPVGSFASVDARIGYRLARWATIAVSGQNLLQAQQRQTSGPEVGRQLYLTLSLLN